MEVEHGGDHEKMEKKKRRKVLMDLMGLCFCSVDTLI